MKNPINLFGRTLFFTMFCIAGFSQNPTSFDLKKVDRLLNSNDFQVKSSVLHPVAEKAISNGTKAGEFKNVTYAFQKNVVLKKGNTFIPIEGKLDKNGLISKTEFQNLKLSTDSIYVSDDSDLVIQSGIISDDNFAIYKPKFEEVFGDFNLPLQTVPITLANTSYTIEGSEVSEKNTSSGYAINMEFKDKKYEFKKDIKKNNVTTKITVNLNVNGLIAYNNPKVEAQYTKNNGCRLVFNASEMVDLTIDSDVKIDFEMAIPVWEFTIPAGSIGSAKVGVFIVVGVGGEVKLVVDIDQSLSIHSGVYGGTAYYFPTSVHYIQDFDQNCDFKYDFSIEKKMKIYGGVDCVADIKVKGYDILKLRVRGALEFSAESTDGNKAFDLSVGFRVLIDGKVKKIDHKFTLLDKYFEIWKKTEKNFGGYTLLVREADAYHNRVHGLIFKTQDSIPYTGNLMLIVTPKHGIEKVYNGATNEIGVFALTDIDLKYGDKVSVKIPDSPNRSEPINCSIPFQEINLNFADYYTNTVQGVISEKVNTFPKLTQPSTSSPTPIGVNQSIAQNIPASAQNLKPKINPNIKKINFRDLIIYNGDIEIIVQPLAHNIQLLNPKDDKPQDKNRNVDKLKVQNNMTPKIDNSISTNVDKIPRIIKKISMKPFGGFEVENVDIKPGDKVKARINVDGFILESNYIVADGLLFSPMIDENLVGNAATQSIKADNTTMSISAIRSSILPKGNVRILKGTDLKHTSKNPLITYPDSKIDLFPSLKNAVVYFDKEIPFNMETKNSSVVINIGKWEVSNPYYSPSNILPHKIGGHNFEFVGLDYEGKWTGYKNYQEICTACGKDLSEKVKPNSILSNDIDPDIKINESPIPEMENIQNMNIKLVQPKVQPKSISKKM